MGLELSVQPSQVSVLQLALVIEYKITKSSPVGNRAGRFVIRLVMCSGCGGEPDFRRVRLCTSHLN